MTARLTSLPPVLLVLMAGCVAPAGLDDDARSMEPCGISYPDGSPFDCSTTQATEAVAESRPAVGSGWDCIKLWKEEGDRKAVFEVYRHTDGRAGLYWEAVPWTTPGAAFVIANVFEPGGKGQALVANWTAKGFVVFPEKPPAKAELHLLTRNVFVDLRDANGVWTPTASTVTTGRFGGHDWYVAQFEAGGTAHAVDLVVAKEKEGSLRTHIPADRLIEGPDWGAYVTVDTWGVKSMEFEFSGALTSGRCAIAPVDRPLAGPFPPERQHPSGFLEGTAAEERA